MTTDRLRALLNTPGVADGQLFSDATTYEKREFLKLAKEAADRSCEGLKLYRPLPFQEAYHKCRAKELLLSKGNRSGGSCAGFAEDARAVTNQDPYGKYPARDGTCVCLGYGEKHIGRVIHKFLFRAGAFQIIRDLETREWRVYKPWPKDQGGDLERASEAKPAPPFIPPRFIEELTWDKRGDRVFSVARLTTGWEIYALNSAGDPSQAQGFDVHLYHIDEDTANTGWYEEAVGRTAIPQGLIRWTALPHARNDDILNMSQRAERDAVECPDNPTTVLLRASMFDNPYYPEESKKANIKIWSAEGDEVVRKRVYGEMVLDSVLMYPTFSRYLHNAMSDTGAPTIAQKAWQEANGSPPLDWCLDMVVDPGHTVCAVSFWATPPPEINGVKVPETHIMYDELYILRCDAEQFANAVEQKVRGRDFQRFIIDAHGGRLREIGTGIMPQRQYETQLLKRNIACVETGSYFIAGSDDVTGREMKLRDWLSIKPDGHTIFLVNSERCPNFVREIERFNKRTIQQHGRRIVLDEGSRRGNTHAVETAEYACAHGLEYVAPPVRRKVNSWVASVLKSRKQRELQRRAKSGMFQSRPGITLGPRGE